MASLRQSLRSDGTVAFRVLYRHEGKQRSETFDNATAQRAFCANVDRLGPQAALEILAAYEGASTAAVPTLAEQIDHHVESLSGIEDGTRADYRRIGRIVAAHPIGRLPINAITKEAIAKWVSQQEGSLSEKTIRNRLMLVSAALQRAVDDELIPYNRARKIKVSRTVREEMVILTPAEVDRLATVAHPHYRPLIRFLFVTGCRFGEATALRVGDVRTNETPATVSIVRAWKRTGEGGQQRLGPPKSKRSRRTIAIPQQLLDVLDLDRRPDELLFPNLLGEPIKRPTFSESWRAWVRRADLGKKPGPHSLRHSHASWMIGRGMNMLDLQHRLGHEDIRTTVGTYGHLLPEAQAQAARMAESMFVSDAAPRALDAAG